MSVRKKLGFLQNYEINFTALGFCKIMKSISHSQLWVFERFAFEVNSTT